MQLYYDKYGKKINTMEWCKLFDDAEYRRIGLTDVSDENFVSTVWIGLDHGDLVGSSVPLIFESMVFSHNKPGEDMDMERYSTLEEAVAGHKKMVEKWTNKIEGVGGPLSA